MNPVTDYALTFGRAPDLELGKETRPLQTSASLGRASFHPGSKHHFQSSYNELWPFPSVMSTMKYDPFHWEQGKGGDKGVGRALWGRMWGPRPVGPNGAGSKAGSGRGLGRPRVGHM